MSFWGHVGRLGLSCSGGSEAEDMERADCFAIDPARMVLCERSLLVFLMEFVEAQGEKFWKELKDAWVLRLCGEQKRPLKWRWRQHFTT
jgi:hypothetical protein